MTPTKRPNSRPVRKPAKPPTTIDAIPERGLKIGEAARMLGVEPYVLRFWETQFPILKPKHSRSRHRFYHARDIETLQVIKRLLHDEGFTIPGANKYLREHGLDAVARASKPAVKGKAVISDTTRQGLDGRTRQVLTEVRRDLESLRKLLAS